MLRLYVSIVCGSFLLANPAVADVLDGDWCNPDSGEMTIHGPTILTPRGYLVIGEYTQHRFAYVAPPGDWYEGKLIFLQQRGEKLMELSVEGLPPEGWVRCPAKGIDVEARPAAMN